MPIRKSKPKKYQRGGFVTGGTDETENARERSLRNAEERAVSNLTDSYVRIGQVPRRKLAPTGNRQDDIRRNDVNQARSRADEILRRRSSNYQSVNEGGAKYKTGGAVKAKNGKRNA